MSRLRARRGGQHRCNLGMMMINIMIMVIMMIMKVMIMMIITMMGVDFGRGYYHYGVLMIMVISQE